MFQLYPYIIIFKLYLLQSLLESSEGGVCCSPTPRHLAANVEKICSATKLHLYRKVIHIFQLFFFILFSNIKARFITHKFDIGLILTLHEPSCNINDINIFAINKTLHQLLLNIRPTFFNLC